MTFNPSLFFQEEIEEMMALLLSQGPGVSADFIDAVKDCITMGGKYISTYLSNYEFDY